MNKEMKAGNTHFDLIVVGSGNGACAFLSECLKHNSSNKDFKILVLEQGQNYFYTSDVTHQDSWSKIYGSGRIFKLHNTKTKNRIPIISGRAVTMGGGGSINFTMIHESAAWLAENVGHDVDYWKRTKEELNCKFKRPDPATTQTPFAQYIVETFQGKDPVRNVEKDEVYAPPSEKNLIHNIPSLNDDYESFPDKEAKQLYIFPTQFNAFGQRTNSGVSLVDWGKVNLQCKMEVRRLVMDADGSTCTGVKVKNLATNAFETFNLKESGRVILACGSQSSRLLMQTPELTNKLIGKRVNDHICMPLGIYYVPSEKKSVVTARDAYEAVFATMAIDPANDATEGSQKELVTLDFFSGEIQRLIFLVSSLYLCYIPSNVLKRVLLRFPDLFALLSNTIRILLTVIVYIYEIVQGLLNMLLREPFGRDTIVITTSLLKFNSVREGQYEMKGDMITLNFFEDERDSTIAEEAIKKNLDLLGSLGSRPWLISLVLRLITKIPYKKSQVRKYVKNFSKKTLLSEQHLAGGCVFGDVVSKGLEDPSETGKVIGSENIYVADLSTVPLPRVSTQMTAYLVGHHVGKQLYGPHPQAKK